MGTNDGDKLDAAMDGLFRRSRLESSPGGDGGGGGSGVAWDDRADAILAAAYAAPASKGGPDAVTEALLAAPDLEHEPGEPAAHAAAAPHSRNGTQQMSDDMSSKPPPSRRPSLKELAESVKNRPSTPAPSSVRSSDLPPSSAGPGSAPGSQRHSLKDTLVALDGQLPAPPSARPHTPAPVGQRGSSPSIPGSSPGPISAGPASAPPSSTGPASTGPASAPVSAPAVALAPSPPASSPIAIPSTKPSPGVGKAAKQGGGAGVGIVIAVIGLAAAAGFGLYLKSKSATPAPTVAAVETAAPAAEPVNDAPKEAAKPEEKKADDGVLDLSQLDDATAASSAAPALGGPLPKTSASAAAAPEPSAVAAAEPPKPGGPGEELGDAIKKRAGGGAGVGEDAEPAAAEGSKKNLPDVPPTGAVTSAVNAVKGGAKGCVAGAEEPSTATITFGSSGAVQSVTVGGWAAGKSAAGCIKSALQAAKVPAFARPSYSTSVTIRP
jgi:hypothetical protein